MKKMSTTIENWLNTLISLNNELQIRRKFNENIRICGGCDNEIHIYEGLEIMAFYLRKTITYDPNCAEGYGKMYFYHNGYKIFELWEIPAP